MSIGEIFRREMTTLSADAAAVELVDLLGAEYMKMARENLSEIVLSELNRNNWPGIVLGFFGWYGVLKAMEEAGSRGQTTKKTSAM